MIVCTSTRLFHDKNTNKKRSRSIPAFVLCSAEVGQGIRGQCDGARQVTEDGGKFGGTHLKKACPSIWCSKPRRATAWAAAGPGSSWLGNCLSLSLGTGLRSPRGLSGAPLGLWLASWPRSPCAEWRSPPSARCSPPAPSEGRRGCCCDSRATRGCSPLGSSLPRPSSGRSPVAGCCR